MGRNILTDHGAAVATINEVWEEREALRSLVIDMGRVIRLLDESGEHSEFWTQDGDYIIDGRFPR